MMLRKSRTQAQRQHQHQHPEGGGTAALPAAILHTYVHTHARTHRRLYHANMELVERRYLGFPPSFLRFRDPAGCGVKGANLTINTWSESPGGGGGHRAARTPQDAQSAGRHRSIVDQISAHPDSEMEARLRRPPCCCSIRGK